MKKVQYKKEQSGDNISIQVKLNKRFLASEPVVNYDNSDMINYLKDQKINVDEYELTSQPPHPLTSHSNKCESPTLEGVWVFTKKMPKIKKRVNKKKTQPYNKGEDKTGG